jgi:hypothetical protein
MVGYAQHLF